jgi:hypothetical protein
MINRSPQNAVPLPSRLQKELSPVDPHQLQAKRRAPSHPGAARHLSQLLLAPSVLFAALQEEVDAITVALTWAVLVGNVLASLLFLWASLRETPRHWSAVLGSGVMLLIALLSSFAALLILPPTRTHSSLFRVLLPLASCVLLAGLYTLTTPDRRLTRRTRALLASLLVATSATLLALFLADLWSW